DGIDNAFDSNNGGTPTVAVDTDADGTPDYLDINSDNDGLVDAVEGWDTTGDASPNTTPAGTDADGDGLDDNYDTINGRNSTTNVYDTPGGDNSSNDYPDETTPDTTERDWREVNIIDTDLDGVPNSIDIDDDNDGVLDTDEGLGVICAEEIISGVTTELLFNDSGSTTANLIDGTYNDAFYFNDGQTYNASNDVIFNVSFADPIVLTDLRVIIDRTASFLENGATYRLEGFDGVSYTDLTGTITSDGNGIAVTTAISTAEFAEIFDLSANTTAYSSYRLLWLSGGVGWEPYILQIEITAAACTTTASLDTDGDGTPDYLDLDSDNDGIFDIIEAGGVDANTDGKVDVFVDGNSNGWANVFDPANGGTIHTDPETDGDGLKNRIDADSDGDGITDLIESQATAGTLVVPIGADSDQDGIDNAFDINCTPCGATTGVPTVPVNTDAGFEISDLIPDYLDTDSDNDGLGDIIEGWDTNGNYAANVTPLGTDADEDGLDDAFDDVVGPNPITNPANSQTANSFPNITTASATTERDWREINNVTCAPGEVDGNLMLWLKADVGGTNWLDQSNNFVSLTRTGTATNGAINFNPTNDFNGTTYYTSNLSINADANPDLAVIAVYKPNRDDAGAVWGENNTDFDRYMQDASGQNNAVSNGSSTENNITGLFANGITTLSTVIFDEDASNGSQVFVNGEIEASFTANHGPETSDNLQIGAIGTGLTRFNGEIAEVIVYNQLLSTSSDRQKIESYLALKYGITLSDNNDGDGNTLETGEGDYIASSGALFWNADEVGGQNFQNNITGIAIDNQSCLIQLQSKSENADAIVTIGLDDNNDGLETSNAQNESVFGADLSALVTGHDGEALYDESANIDYDPAQITSRLNREWRVQETGTVGQITIRFDVSNLIGPGDVVGANDEALIVLLVDADGDFSSGASIVTQSFVVDSDGLVNFQVDFTDGNYYTLGSSEDNALPITLLSFGGEPKKDHIVINWSTTSEINNSLYGIERSADGKFFEPIAYLNGTGTTEDINHYEIKDKNPLIGKNYYRLIDIDNNGLENASEMILIEYYKTLRLDLRPYPNPIKKGATFYIDLDEEIELGDVKLHHINGSETPIKTERNRDKLSIYPTQLEQGIFVLSIWVNGKRTAFKVMVRN
ncbi:MAG: hypothetical protein ACJAXX_000314, partial [Roseivirga sp.]